MNDTLMLGYSEDAARKAREQYRTLLGALLILEAAAGLGLLLFPGSVARVLGHAVAAPAWVRLTGLLLLAVAAMLASGQLAPARSKALNLLGMVAHFALGVVLVLQGGALLWIGIVEIVASVALALLYFKYFEAEVMSRP